MKIIILLFGIAIGFLISTEKDTHKYYKNKIGNNPPPKGERPSFPEISSYESMKNTPPPKPKTPKCKYR